jgi:DNA-binding response OmpR family regulator
MLQPMLNIFRGLNMAAESLLLVEDEPLIALFLADALEESGYSVSLCGTGFDALNYIEMEDGLAAVVTDIRLGDGPDGWEVARRARQHFPNAQVVYISGFLDAESADEAVPESAILRKPIEQGELVRAVATLLRRQSKKLKAVIPRPRQPRTPARAQPAGAPTCRRKVRAS